MDNEATDSGVSVSPKKERAAKRPGLSHLDRLREKLNFREPERVFAWSGRTLHRIASHPIPSYIRTHA